MAPRTTATAVRSIIKTDTSLSLTGFISTAASLVNKLSSADTDGVHSDSDLELIERWLAAHFYAHRDQLLQQKQTGRASGTFQGKTAMALDSTQYGQTAMVLDTTGYLAQLNKTAKEGKRELGITWLGSEDETRVDV